MVLSVKKGISAAASVVAIVAVATLLGIVPGSAAATDTAGKERAVLVDVNTATTADLEKVPGIGPALAKRIVEFREKNGPYPTIDDLLKIQGIGEK